MTPTIRILIADDHPIFRAGLKQTLNEAPGLEVCGEAGDAQKAVIQARALHPDLVLLDLSMPGGGHQAMEKILHERPDQRVLVLTASEEDDDVLRALKAGARGYVLKGTDARALAEIVQATMGGAYYISPSLAVRILREFDPRLPTTPARAESRPAEDATLTPREKSILEHLAMGMTNKAIARSLGLEEKTVKNHMTRIMAKLNARSRLEAALLFRRARDRDQSP